MSRLSAWLLRDRPIGCGLVVAAVLMLAGCAAGPDFVRPPTPALSRYTPSDPVAVPGEAGAAAQTIRQGRDVPERWWRAFGSPALDELVAQALAASPTQEAARATAAQAAALLAAARGGAYPEISIGASVTRANGTRSGVAGASGNLFELGPAATFDPDAFGGIRRRIEQAQAVAEFQQAQWQAARLTLAGNTVLQSIALATAAEQIIAVRDIIGVDQRNLELVQISATAGKSARLDVLTSESQLSSDLALLPPLEQQASVARHALAVLAGKMPAEWSPPEFDLTKLALPQELPLTLPSRLVRNHPDIRAAEAQLHAANAAIGIATAQLYPGVTLSANWTATAGTAGGLFGGDTLWNLAASLVAPVFNGHTLAAQRDAAVEAYAAQLANYRQALLQVFGRVADVLESLSHDAAQLQAQYKALETAQAALALTQDSYQAGQASLLQLLESQRLYQQARLGYARSKGQRYSDTAQLFIALGGSSELAGSGNARPGLARD
jgi:NodT family efflux transporter outer membrane factor (OMF) lipoprotein